MGKNIKNNILIIGIVLITGILVSGCYNFNDLLTQGNITDLNDSIVDTNKTREENLTVEFDPEILDRFNQGRVEVPVLVKIRDNSNININKNLTKEENIQILKQRDEWFKPKINQVLKSIPETEIRDINFEMNGFSAYITENAFNKLINDPNVEEIIKELDRDISVDSNKSI